MRERPLSPHLSVYRFKYTLTTSITNRITGLVLSAGLPLLVYWLMAVASGAEAYARADAWFSHALVRAFLALLIVAWVYHTLNGIRHLVWDTGRGLERHQARNSAYFVGAATVAVALAIGYFAFFGRGGTP